MNITGEKLKPSRKYRWKLSTALLSFSPLLVTGPGLVLGVALLLLLRNFFIAADIGLLSMATSFMVGTAIVVLLVFFLAYIAILVQRYLFSHLLVSPEGLDYRYGLTYRLRCMWDDVERIGQRQRSSIFLISSDILFLKDTKVSDLPFVTSVSTMLSPNQQPVVYLGRYRGWPNGELADDLRHYAPHLFDGEAKAE